jgi:hypothetical protein
MLEKTMAPARAGGPQKTREIWDGVMCMLLCRDARREAAIDKQNGIHSSRLVIAVAAKLRSEFP